MTAALDPINQNFIKELSKGQPLYEKTPEDARKVLETLQKHTPSPHITQDYIDVPFASGSVKTVIFRPQNANRDVPSIFYTHGGGWILGSPTVFGSLMEDLARQTGAAVIFPHFTPAPEKQYPSQFEELFAVLTYFVEHGTDHNLKTETMSFAGDSAGGQMAIAMVQLALRNNLALNIAHLVLFYPVTDTHKKSTTYETFKEGPYLSERTMDWMVDAFLPNKADRCNSLTSPLSFLSDGELAQFPPTTLFLSGADPLIAEGEAFGLRLQENGVETSIMKADGQIHDYVMLEPIRRTATAKAVVELAAAHLKKSLE